MSAFTKDWQVNPSVGSDSENGSMHTYISEGEKVDRVRAKYSTHFDPLPEPMGEAAYYGAAGEAVGIMEEYSEACREALLLQLLVMAGNTFGRSIYAIAGGQVFANEFTVLIGQSAQRAEGLRPSHGPINF